MIFSRLFIIVALVFLSPALIVSEVIYPAPPETLALHGHIASATKQSDPVFSGGYLVLPYRGERSPYRFVGIAFDYENFSRIHAFVRNKKGTFVFYGKIPEGVTEFRYRLVVDSVWQHDSANPETELDKMGVILSKFIISSKFDPLREELGPQFNRDGSIDFLFRGQAGVYSFIMGNFNQWDPFMTPMKEISPGLYKVTLRLRPGRYYYNFLFNGQRMRDPNNFFQGIGSGGELVSVLDVPVADNVVTAITTFTDTKQ